MKKKLFPGYVGFGFGPFMTFENGIFFDIISPKQAEYHTIYNFRDYATYRKPKKISKKNSEFFQFFPNAGTVEENT